MIQYEKGIEHAQNKKLCESVGKSEKFDECIKGKTDAIKNAISRGKAADDYKAARGEIYNSLKQSLQLTQCGNNADTFIRDTLAPLITPEMEVYKMLETEIFKEKEYGL